MSTLGAIGTVPNNTVFQGIVKSALAHGITTSTWNRLSGGTSRTHYEGTQEQITSLARDCKTAGYEYSIQGGAVWSIDITFPWDVISDNYEIDSNPLYVWELVNQPFERDLFELNERQFVASLSIETKDNIQLKLNANNRTSPAWDPIDRTSISKMVNATVLYNLKRIGVRGKPSPVQTLKRTLIVPQTYSAAINDIKPEYDYKVFTTDQLKTLYSYVQTNPLNQIPSMLQEAMPEVLTLQDFTGDIFNVSGYSMDKNGIVTFVGWLQFPNEYHMVSNNKLQITQAWTFNQWSTGPWGLYDTAYPATSPDPEIILSPI